MQFSLTIPRKSGAPAVVELKVGETLFVLGPNGSGKSSLMHRFFVSYRDQSVRIAAHRQSWFQSDSPGMTAETKRVTETTLVNQEAQPQARWKDDYPGQRLNVVLFDLVEAGNVMARAIADAVRAKDIPSATAIAEKDTPLKIVNELLRLSNVPVVISQGEFDRLVASKNGCPPYGVTRLSDGERNALLIAATVLTARSGALILIDEPERHLHRSITAPMLRLLSERRPDCVMVISTHDVQLPLARAMSRTLLIRDCTFSGDEAVAWETNEVEPGLGEQGVDEDLKIAILGARAKVLFVEGTDASLDKPLYSLVFPNCSIVARASSRDVEHGVAAVRAAPSLHWLHAFGIIDNDGRAPGTVAELKAAGVYALSVYSVESLYYHPTVMASVTKRLAKVTGADPNALLAAASTAAVNALKVHAARLCARAAEKAIRHQILSALPTQKDVAALKPIAIELDTAGLVARERERFDQAIASARLETIIKRYPVRETPALDQIAEKLGFQDRSQYEAAVRKLLLEDSESLAFVRSLFDALPAELDSA
jgi:ABC-type lipoprotein export system ATPase subunit